MSCHRIHGLFVIGSGTVAMPTWRSSESKEKYCIGHDVGGDFDGVLGILFVCFECVGLEGIREEKRWRNCSGVLKRMCRIAES
jgi:hypothetical protein